MCEILDSFEVQSCAQNATLNVYKLLQDLRVTDDDCCCVLLFYLVPFVHYWSCICAHYVQIYGV